MSEVQKDRQYHIPIAHVDIVSSNTGVSQYLRAPLIPWNSNPRSSSDLRLLLKPSVGQSFLADEREARAAAYLYWVVLQPVLLSSELNEIMQNTVVALKREGKQTFSSLASGQQGALQLALKLGMYRISGSYPVIRLSGPFFTIRYPAIRYPVCYSIIRYPAGYHTGIRPDTG